MTASGSCEVCKGVATNYISQLKIWRCNDHSITTTLSPEAKLMELQRYMNKNKEKKKPKNSKSPFGKKYF